MAFRRITPAALLAAAILLSGCTLDQVLEKVKTVLTTKYNLILTNDAFGTTSPSGGVEVGQFAPFSVTALPMDGYRFSSWTVTSGTGVDIADASSASTTVTLSGGNATVKANFEPNIVFVNSAYPGSDANNGKTALTAKATITAGMSAVLTYGTSGEVRVAQGTYSEAITLAHGVSLYGGYTASFLSRNPAAYLSTITGGASSQIIDARPATVTNADVVDGFRLESIEGAAVIAINLDGSGSPTIQNNEIRLKRTSADTPTLFAVVSSGGYVRNARFLNNRIWCYRTNCTSTHAVRVMELRANVAGSNVIVSGNQIYAYGNAVTRALDIDKQYGGEINLTNNFISVSGAGTSYGVYFVNTHTLTRIVNNTIVATGSYAYAIGSTNTGTVTAVNNILGGRGIGVGAAYGSGSTLDFRDNLVFNFATNCSGFTPDGTNQLVTSDIFLTVFNTTSYDADFSDGHTSDYHLLDTGAVYAVDQGMDTSSAALGSVTTDIDGQTRPRGSSYDRGGDEK